LALIVYLVHSGRVRLHWWRTVWLGHFLDVRSVECESNDAISMQHSVAAKRVLCDQNNHYKEVFSNPGPNVQGAIVASMPAGSLIGALVVTWLGDKIGRKRTIIIAGIIWVLGSILQCASVVSAVLFIYF
jgi:MFS family permease